MSNVTTIETTIDRLYLLLDKLNLSPFHQKVFVLWWLEDINFHDEYKKLCSIILTPEEHETFSKLEDNDLQKSVSEFSRDERWGCELYDKELIEEITKKFK